MGGRALKAVPSTGGSRGKRFKREDRLAEGAGRRSWAMPLVGPANLSPRDIEFAGHGISIPIRYKLCLPWESYTSLLFQDTPIPRFGVQSVTERIPVSTGLMAYRMASHESDTCSTYSRMMWITIPPGQFSPTRADRTPIRSFGTCCAARERVPRQYNGCGLSRASSWLTGSGIHAG